MAVVARILSLTVENDVESDPKMRDEIVLELQANPQRQYKLLHKMEDLINTHLLGKYMRVLVFLLHKASKVTRTFNKKTSGNRARERVKFLEELNTVHQKPNSTIHDIEEVENFFTNFDEEDILLKNKNFRMFDDERSTSKL